MNALFLVICMAFMCVFYSTYIVGPTHVLIRELV